jgi:hypothetical protein
MDDLRVKIAAALAAGALVAACATGPRGGTNPTGTEGQTLGGYVATGAVDPDHDQPARPGDEDETPDGAPAPTPPEE